MFTTGSSLCIYRIVPILTLILCCVEFINLNTPNTIQYDAQSHNIAHSTEYNRRRQKQEEFLKLISDNQANCSNPKVIILELFGNNFAATHHVVGHALLTAVATNRRLHIVHNAKECDGHSLINSWKCIYKPLTPCILSNDIKSAFEYPLHPEFSYFRYYLTLNHEVTYFNNVTLYKILDPSSTFRWMSGIFESQWFGKYGNAFIRSFVQFYIWMNMNDKIKAHIENNSLIQRVKSTKCIGRHFGKELDNYADVMNKKVGNPDLDLETMIVSDDDRQDFNLNEEIINVEVLRLCQYLAGSGKSSMFRLAMELHFATNWADNDFESDQTVFTVDIPWIQDP